MASNTNCCQNPLKTFKIYQSDALIKAQFYYRDRIEEKKSKELRTYNTIIINNPTKVLQRFL